MSEEALAGASWVWNNWETIQKRLEAVFRLFRKTDKPTPKERRILIIGPGGVGKSTLARLLVGDLDWLTGEPWKYDQSFGPEEQTLGDSDGIEIIVPPGQSQERELRWDGLGAKITAGEFQGIILVSAFGYHSIVIPTYKDHKLYEGSKDAFLEAYLHDRRQLELGVLKSLLPYMVAAPKKLWLMTVVAKEDLWFADRLEVQKYYWESDYGETVTELGRRKGLQNFRHETVAASFVICNLTTQNEILAKNTAGYDQQQQIQSIQRVLEQVTGLTEWEAQP